MQIVKFDRGKNFIQRHLYKHFQLPMLLSLITPILGHSLTVRNTGFLPLRQNHLMGLRLKVVTEFLSYIVIIQLFLFLDLDGLF